MSTTLATYANLLLAPFTSPQDQATFAVKLAEDWLRACVHESFLDNMNLYQLTMV